MDELQKEAIQEQKKLEKVEIAIRKKIERLDKELAEERQKLSKLIRDLPSREKLNLPQISKFVRLDKLDREMIQTLIKRIEVHEDGKVAISFAV
jgi:predicted RNase H-like nuclease (RuvC/YqgF family)